MDIPAEFPDVQNIRELVSVPNPQDVNCHKAVLYLAGLISYSDLISDSKAQKEEGLDFMFEEKARAISNKIFTPVSTVDDLYEIADKECIEPDVYIGQILDSVSNEMAHSFLLARRDAGYTCFDKAGFKKPFSVYPLRKLLDFDNYQHQLWRFLRLSEAR